MSYLSNVPGDICVSLSRLFVVWGMERRLGNGLSYSALLLSSPSEPPPSAVVTDGVEPCGLCCQDPGAQRRGLHESVLANLVSGKM